MKILVASDLHGSLYYAKELERVFYSEGAKQILLLGDLLYHGPRNPLTRDYNPLAVSELLNKYAPLIWAVRGNCDSEVDQMVLDFKCDGDLFFFQSGDLDVIASHGHVYFPDNLPKSSRRFLFLSGHIHVPVAQSSQDAWIGNPSSLALPKDDIPSYGILENRTWTIKDLAGNVRMSLECE